MKSYRGISEIEKFFGNRVQYFRIKSGESRIIRFITPPDKLFAVFEHTEQIGGHWKNIPCIGENCPLCAENNRPSLKIYSFIIDREDNTVKVFKMSKTVAQQIPSMVEEYGDITKRDFKVYRQGEKLNTVYQFFPKDPTPLDISKFEIPNFEDVIKSYSKEEIENLLNGTEMQNIDNISNNIAQNSDFPF